MKWVMDKPTASSADEKSAVEPSSQSLEPELPTVATAPLEKEGLLLHESFLSLEQRDSLEESLVTAGATRRPDIPIVNLSGASFEEGTVEIYYDTAAYALTERGWWLRMVADTWTLSLPVNEKIEKENSCRVGYELIDKTDHILDKLGLTSYAEVLRKRAGHSMAKVLKDAKVVPFARISTEQSVYELNGNLAICPSCSALGEKLLITLSVVHFDPSFGEDAAVADLLFTHEGKASLKCHMAMAEFRLLSGHPTSELCSNLLMNLGAVDTNGPPVKATLTCPKLLEYLKILRPVHFNRLSRDCPFAISEQAPK